MVKTFIIIIFKCIRESIKRITNQPFNIDYEITLNQILGDTILTSQCKKLIVEYCNNDTFHEELNLKFKELLCYVWKTLDLSEHKIKKIYIK